MRPETCSKPLHPAALRGLELFNEGKYFEAHEELETAWRAERGPIRVLYQGILQVAVAYLHTRNRNYEGAVKLAERASSKLQDWPEVCRGVHVGALRSDLSQFRAMLTRLGRQGLENYDLNLFKPVIYEY